MSFKSFFHNILRREEAKEKILADRVNKTYQGRRSPLNADCYILSYQVNGKFRRFPIGSRGRLPGFGARWTPRLSNSGRRTRPLGLSGSSSRDTRLPRPTTSGMRSLMRRTTWSNLVIMYNIIIMLLPCCIENWMKLRQVELCVFLNVAAQFISNSLDACAIKTDDV